ncbi:hypothetical protein M8J75_015141 [Diaphorina citri]|nr:hypothetical protein M8J75_015141 [Diaphorina citri]
MAVSKENSNHHESLTSLLNCIDLLKENCASCVRRPSGNVKKDLSIKYNAEKLKYKEKLEEENHKAKLELNKLIDEISYKRNRIDRMKTELPELDDSIDKIQSINYRAHELNKEKIKDIEI